MADKPKDTRSAEVKKAQDNQKAFEQEFNPTPAPRAELVTFQVVGLLPSPGQANSGIDAVLSSLVGTNYGFGAVIPSDSLAALPDTQRHVVLLRDVRGLPGADVADALGLSLAAMKSHLHRGRAALRAGPTAARMPARAAPTTNSPSSAQGTRTRSTPASRNSDAKE